MIKLLPIKKNIIQIAAIIKKNLKLKLRFKMNLIMSYLAPIFNMIMPLILMGQLFNFKNEFGPWNISNFIVYLFLAYNINLLRGVIVSFPSKLREEKYWETLPALIIAPFNRFNLLFGIFFSEIIIRSIPFTVIFVICYFYFPINLITILFVLEIYFLIALLFSGIGLILGIFAVSKESVLGILKFLLNLFFLASCISYPFDIFPELLQIVINLNPLYYIFDMLRLSWIENDIVVSIATHTFHLIILIMGSLILPLMGVIIFNKIYNKYGIVGY